MAAMGERVRMGFTAFWAVCWGAEVEGAGLEQRGGGMTAGSQMGCQKCICGGEQLHEGAATLPTLSFLRRINDCVRPVLTRECAGLTHTLPPPRTRSPHLSYTDVIDPRHATFTLNNAEGRNGCL